MRLRLLLCALFVCGCVPYRNLAVEEIDQLADFDELMWTLATVADDRFALAEDVLAGGVPEDSLAAFLDMGTRVAYAARRIPELSGRPELVILSEQLEREAREVADAAAAGELEGAARMARRVERTCAACHADFR